MGADFEGDVFGWLPGVLEKQARDLGEHMDEEGTARSPRLTAEGPRTAEVTAPI